MTNEIAAFVAAGRRVGFSLNTRTVMALARFHGVDAGEVFKLAGELEPRTRFIRRGRPKGHRGRCSSCGRLGHNKTTCRGVS